MEELDFKGDYPEFVDDFYYELDSLIDMVEDTETKDKLIMARQLIHEFEVWLQDEGGVNMDV